MNKNPNNENYVIDIDGDVFACLRKDINTILRRMLSNMQSKGSESGEITVKIEVSAINESIPDAVSGEGAYRDIVRPEFKHTVSSTMKIQDKETGKFSGEYELVWDKDTCQWIAKKIENGQVSIDELDEMEPQSPVADEQRMLSGSVGSLPSGDDNEDNGNRDYIEADFREIGEDED